MAKKTDAEIGNSIRTIISNLTLAGNEEIQKVRIIAAVEVKNTDSQAVYPKGGKGIELDKYNASDEELTNLW